MKPSDVVFLTISVLGLAAAALMAIVVAWLVIRTIAGRPFSRVWLPVLVAAWGWELGLLIVTTDRFPAIRVLAITVVVVEFLGLAWRNRRRLAGVVLAGATLPWMLLWAAYLVEILFLGARWDPYVVWAFFLFGGVPFVVGVLLAAFSDGGPTAPDRRAPVGHPGSRRIGTVAYVLRGPRLAGLGATDLVVIILMVAVGWITASLVARLPRVEAVGVLVVGIAVAAAIGWILYPIAWSSRLRRAHEAFMWLGEWERARFFALAGEGAAFTPKDLIGWVDAHPESPADRWFRYEVLALAERMDEARAVAERLPSDTPFEQAEKAAALDLVDWMAGGEGDMSAVRSAVDAIEPSEGDDRLRAEVIIAVMETKRLAAEGAADPLAPLVAVRERLGSRADGLMVRVMRRQITAAPLVRLAATVVLTVVAMDVLTRDVFTRLGH